MRTYRFLTAALFLLACSSDPNGVSLDGGADAGGDAGVAVDGGTQDGGAPFDGGVPPFDGGVTLFDGGVTLDAGTPADGGGAVDGGSADGGPGLDGGGADGGGADGGLVGPATWCELPGSVTGAVVPAGFCVRQFAQVQTPRVLAFAPNGDLFVGAPSSITPGGAPSGLGGIYALYDDDKNGVADINNVYLSGPQYSSLHGVLFHQGRLHYTTRDSVMSVPYAAGERRLPVGTTATRVADLSDPGVSDRFTHTLAADAMGRLYVSRGQFDNATCPPPNPRGGSVLRIGAGQHPNGDVVMTGFRNPMYINCAPWGCYAAELTGDAWFGIGGKEKLVKFRDGDNYGYPCCVENNRPVPGVTPAPDCSTVAVQVQSYPLADTPFGFDWDVARTFPEPYRGGLFMAFHGSFDRWVNVGLGFIKTDAVTGDPIEASTPFVTGWGRMGPIVGRPADVKFAPDGRMFFADDQAGGIYWVAPTTLRRPGR